MRRPTLRQIAEEALRQAKEAKAECLALGVRLDLAYSAMHSILDRLAAFLKWAEAYGWDDNDPFQRRALALVRDLQDEALKAFAGGGPAPRGAAK